MLLILLSHLQWIGRGMLILGIYVTVWENPSSVFTKLNRVTLPSANSSSAIFSICSAWSKFLHCFSLTTRSGEINALRLLLIRNPPIIIPTASLLLITSRRPRTQRRRMSSVKHTFLAINETTHRKKKDVMRRWSWALSNQRKCFLSNQEGARLRSRFL